MPSARRGSCWVVGLCCWGWRPLTAAPQGWEKLGHRLSWERALQSPKEEASAELEGGHRLASTL